MDKLYIVIPAYNEQDNIEEVVKDWYPVVEKTGAESRLVIIDDGSKDATYEKLQELCQLLDEKHAEQEADMEEWLELSE